MARYLRSQFFSGSSFYNVSVLRTAVAVSWLLLGTGCGGLSYLSAEDLCEGPHCEQACSISTDCPAGAHCVLGRCSTSDHTGNDNGGGSSDDDDGIGGDNDDSSVDDDTDDDTENIDHDADLVLVSCRDIDIDGDGYCTCSAAAAEAHIYNETNGLIFDPSTCDGDAITCCSDFCCPQGRDCPGGEGNPHVFPCAEPRCDGLDNSCRDAPGVSCQGDEDEDDGCNNTSYGTPGCACNTEADTCQAGCACDADCPDCACDITDGVCDAGCACDTACYLPPPTNTAPGAGNEGGWSPDGGDSLVQNPDGSISLREGETVQTDFAWPSNDPEGTISRVDTIGAEEVGRYATVLRSGGEPGVPDWNSGCNRPSRSTVDAVGNAYIANRAHADSGPCNSDVANRRRGSVTKIGLYTETHCGADAPPDFPNCPCIDRDGSETIDTSRDIDGDGHIRLTPFGSGPFEGQREFLGYDDECLLWTTRLPYSDANPRAMAIDAHGFLWVGDWQRRRVYKLDPTSGALLDPDGAGPATTTGIDISGYSVRPYGAVVDSQGILWLLNDYNIGDLLAIDTETGAVVGDRIDNEFGGYGITIDRRNRVWLPSYHVGTASGTIVRYDPSAPEGQRLVTFSAGLSNDTWRGRGVTATPAGEALNGSDGLVWAAFHRSNSPRTSWLIAFNDNTGAVERSVNLTTACNARRVIGVGIGAAKKIWVVNQDTDNACVYDPYENTTEEVPIGAAPYTYSDFTGNILRTFTAAERGTYNIMVKGCGENERPEWKSVNWHATTPGDSRLVVSIFTSNNPGALSANVENPHDHPSVIMQAPAAGETLAQPPSTSVDDIEWIVHNGSVHPPDYGAYIRVRFLFERGEDGSYPTLYSVNVARECHPILDPGGG